MTEVAYEQLKSIRDRAGIEPGGDGLYGLKDAMSQEEMREAIHLERRIELAFEEHLYLDIRRWKTAEEMGNRELHGVRIIGNPNDGFTYEVIPVAKVTFSTPKMYLYPIPFYKTN